MIKKLVAIGVVGLVAAMGTTLGWAASASAAAPGVAASNAPAPVCIESKLTVEDAGLVDWIYHDRVENHCTGTFTVKIVIRAHSDSACHTLARGQEFTHSWDSIPHGEMAPEGVVLC